MRPLWVPMKRRSCAWLLRPCQVGLPDYGPHAIKLLVQTHGLTLELLRAAVLSELDRRRDDDQDR